MKIHGFNTLTLLDYPEHVAAVLFLGSCNFRCPYCQNAGLVLHPDREPAIPEEEVLAYLKKRRGMLEGVCISGGEPTLHNELPRLVRQIKELGYKVKIDTNGTRPVMLRSLYEEGLVDYIAMDIKASRENYPRVCDVKALPIDAVKESAAFLMTSGIDYEFRTTVVKELHDAGDFQDIATWLPDCRRYYLQSFRSSDNIIKPGFSSYSRPELEAFLEILHKKIPLAELRGID